MNEIEIRKAFEVFKPNKQIVEIRALSKDKVLSGYFSDVDSVIGAVKSLTNDYQVYFVLNQIKEACKSREQFGRLIPSKITTSDSDIEGRTWFLVDIDPVRPSGVSATDGEKDYAKQVAHNVFIYLDNVGFSKPVVCDSGNGFHLIYKISMINNQDNTLIIKNVLECLDFMFSNDCAKVDISVFNASRIVKLYGTEAKKGTNTSERPFRESKLVSVPDKIMPTSFNLFEKISNSFPKPQAPSYKNHYNGVKFDLAGWLEKYHIDVEKVVKSDFGTKYILKHCVFDYNHTNGSAMIFQMASGVIGYKCLHASCQNKTWKDVRLMFEPNAYSKYSDFKKARDNKPINRDEKDAIKQIWVCTSDIKPIDRAQIISIPSGVAQLDKNIVGFNLGDVSVWSGTNGSGKSSFLSQLAITDAQLGFRTAIFSGEMPLRTMKNWILLQSAGRQYTKAIDGYDGLYYVPNQYIPYIDNWLKDKIYIYNNDNGNEINTLLDCMSELVNKQKIDQFILDNLMALDLSRVGADLFNEQRNAILAIVDFAKKYNVHIHIVCHPRKPMGFLRKVDISGSSNITDAASNVFIIHRVGTDFKTQAKNFFGEQEARKYYNFSNVIEVCKNRDLGCCDKMFGLYYEPESKRFMDSIYDNPVYNWVDDYNKERMVICDDDSLPF